MKLRKVGNQLNLDFSTWVEVWEAAGDDFTLYVSLWPPDFAEGFHSPGFVGGTTEDRVCEVVRAYRLRGIEK